MRCLFLAATFMIGSGSQVWAEPVSLLCTGSLAVTDKGSMFSEHDSSTYTASRTFEVVADPTAGTATHNGKPVAATFSDAEIRFKIGAPPLLGHTVIISRTTARFEAGRMTGACRKVEAGQKLF